MTGRLEQIYFAPSHGAPLEPVEAAKLVNGRGLEGDRYYNTSTGVVSLIEAEAIQAFNERTGLSIDAGMTRRCLVTRGIELNPLVGSRFRIGEVELEGFELCEPCASLGNSLATDSVSASAVVKAFLTSAGLRAYVRGTGVVRPGEPLAIL
ncbi:MAG: MOSC domain-containing protein [Pseudomonadales bacterium]